MSTTTAFSRKEVDKIEGHRSIVAIKNLLNGSAGEGNEFVDCATFFYRPTRFKFFFALQRARVKQEEIHLKLWMKKRSEQKERKNLRQQHVNMLKNDGE